MKDQNVSYKWKVQQREQRDLRHRSAHARSVSKFAQRGRSLG